ncbi:MAG: hypothetical protein VKP62_06115, partial [Candidatus Sericytochromatia bacterium]|nr:hypothetical protein [Candidatus Sericytochromatia bacterium]
NRAQVQAISGVASFARQLYIRKEARNEHLLAALSHYAPEDQRALLVRVCEFLSHSHFGKAR